MLTRLARSWVFSNEAKDGDGNGNTGGNPPSGEKMISLTEVELNKRLDSRAAQTRKAVESEMKTQFKTIGEQAVESFRKAHGIDDEVLSKWESTLSESERLQKNYQLLNDKHEALQDEYKALQLRERRSHVESIAARNDANDPELVWLKLRDEIDDKTDINRAVINLLNERPHMRKPEATGGTGTGKGAGAGPPEKPDYKNPETRINALKEGRAKGMW